MKKFIDVSSMPEKLCTSERMVAGKVSGKLWAVSLLNSQEVAVEPEQQPGAIVRDVFLETSKVCETCSGAIIADLQQHLDSQSASPNAPVAYKQKLKINMIEIGFCINKIIP